MLKKIVLFLMVGTSVLMAEMIRSNEHVSDTITELVWQDDNRTIWPNIYYWPDAITQCEALSLDGFDDWRLPNINELYSIVEHSYTPTISPVFQNTEVFKYWSSTTDSSDITAASARLVDFSVGSDFGENKTLRQFVRCVRAGE